MTIMRYLLGFFFSLILTLAAYTISLENKDQKWLIAVLGILAVTQMIVQLIFFLHLGDEQKLSYKLWSFIFMCVTLLIIVAGSIWIMYNMNYNMQHMSSDQKQDYMMRQYDKGF